MNLSRRRFGIGLCGCASLALLGCASAPPARNDANGYLAPGYRPDSHSDEGGLWAMMERAERDLADSRFLLRERELNDYVRSIICRLSPDHCGDLRQYVVRTPLFNASMAPNGMMQVWTGLLLRCRDEAQLAAVIGHEMGHYLHRHTLQRYRDIRSKSDLSAFLGLGLAVGGVGWAASLSDLALLASIFAFNREQERQADAVGVELMAAAGYAPMAAAEVWDQLIEELKHSTGEQRNSLFFATHPEPDVRLGTIRRLAQERGGASGERGHASHLAGLRNVRGMLFDDELALRQYGRSEVVFDRLLAGADDDGHLWFAKGEIHRLRAGPEDADRALASYARAEQVGGAPPELYRSRGLVELNAGRADAARRAFATYLQARPDAGDRAMIRALMPQ